MQTLLLVRHAIAEPRGVGWPDDGERPLTSKGEARMREIAGRLMALGENSDVILTSPLTRAMETARNYGAASSGTSRALSGGATACSASSFCGATR